MKITVHLQAKVWQQFYIDVPEGETPESYVAKLKESDPACNNTEPDNIEYLSESEEPIMAEYYNEDEAVLIDKHTFEATKTQFTPETVNEFLTMHTEFTNNLCADIERLLKTVGGLDPSDEAVYDNVEFFHYSTCEALEIQSITPEGKTNTGFLWDGEDQGKMLRELIEGEEIPLYDAVSLWRDLKKLNGERYESN